MLYVRDELSYDKWIPHTRDLYLLEETSHIPGLPVTPFAMVSFPLVTAIGERARNVDAKLRQQTADVRGPSHGDGCHGE